ncbi:MAG: thymidylate kinase, partial [Pontixanthobacter sp.]
RAYQGGASGLGDRSILTLHEMGSGGLLPDMTILIDVTTAEVDERLRLRDFGGADAIGGRGAIYHKNVARYFDNFASENPDRIIRVNGQGSVDAVHRRIRNAVIEQFKSAF